jgi:orotidine-5'-phosphate decarboxylase
VVVGLDPDLGRMPPCVLPDLPDEAGDPAAAARSVTDFNRAIIDAVADLVPAVKPQVAFYERLGLDGLEAYAATIEHAHRRGLLVIGDVKRGDIGSTAAAYAEGHLGEPPPATGRSGLTADAVTVNPYLGRDGVAPFIECASRHGRGLFVLVKTSNPSSGELQDLAVAGDGGHRTLHEVVASLVARWGTEAGVGASGYSPVGAVVGATYPDHARRLRRLMPHAIFLVPGYGAQGGGAADVVPCFDRRGLGAVVSASRSVLYAWQRSGEGDRFTEHARLEVQRMIADITAALRRSGRALGG